MILGQKNLSLNTEVCFIQAHYLLLSFASCNILARNGLIFFFVWHMYMEEDR